jgi:hypothetical protein
MMNPSMIGSNVVNVVFQEFVVIRCDTPNTCNVFVMLEVVAPVPG